MMTYFMDHPDRILTPLAEHVELVLVTLVVSVILAAILTVLSIRVSSLRRTLIHLFSIVYSIPSLALFALLIPLTGLGKGSATIVLVLYNQYILLENFLTGLFEVDPYICQAAQGMGMTDMQILTKVRLPLAKQALFAGLRLAVVSTIGIGTIASAINAGGLGDLLFDGLRTMNLNKIGWGCVLSGGLAIVVNAVLKQIEKKV